MHLHTFNFNYNLNGCFTVDKLKVCLFTDTKKKQSNNVMVLISLRSKYLEDERKNKKIYEEK